MVYNLVNSASVLELLSFFQALSALCEQSISDVRVCIRVVRKIYRLI